MKFGLDLPPQQRVFAGFFVYSFCMGSLPPRLPDLQRMMQVKEGLLGFGLMILGRFDPAPHRTGTSDEKPQGLCRTKVRRG